jgi:hypothetical protein
MWWSDPPLCAFTTAMAPIMAKAAEIRTANFVPIFFSFNIIDIQRVNLRICVPDSIRKLLNTIASGAALFKKIKPLEIEECPFANPPEKKAGRWVRG